MVKRASPSAATDERATCSENPARQAGWGRSLLTYHCLLMPRALVARTVSLPAREGSPADQNGGTFKQKPIGRAATGPRALRVEDNAPRHAFYQGPRGSRSTWEATTAPTFQSPRKRAMAVRPARHRPYHRSRTPFRLSLLRPALRSKVIHDRLQATGTASGPVHDHRGMARLRSTCRIQKANWLGDGSTSPHRDRLQPTCSQQMLLTRLGCWRFRGR